MKFKNLTIRVLLPLPLRTFCLSVCATGCLVSAYADPVQTYDSRGLKKDFWSNVFGNDLVHLTTDSRFPNSPTSTELFKGDFRIPITPTGSL